MNSFIQKFKTTEFWASLLGYLLVVQLSLKSSEPLVYHSVGLTILLSSYMLSRSFFKRMRSVAHVKGIVTSEFHFALLGLCTLAYFVFKSRLEIGMAVLLGCILISVYLFSRGYAKQLLPRSTPFL